MTIYLVVTNDSNGENQDLFVNADTPGEAVQMLLKYYERERDDFEDGFRVFPVPMPLVKGPTGREIAAPLARLHQRKRGLRRR